MAWKTSHIRNVYAGNIFVLMLLFLITYSCHAIYINLGINCSNGRDATLM